MNLTIEKRALQIAAVGLPSTGMPDALAMELAVTPMLWTSQMSFARRFNANVPMPAE